MTDKNNRLIQIQKSNKLSPKNSAKADSNACNDCALTTELDNEFHILIAGTLKKRCLISVLQRSMTNQYTCPQVLPNKDL